MKTTGTRNPTKKLPKEILVARVERGERLAQVVVKMKDEVGATASVDALTASLKVDVRQSLTYSLLREGCAIYNAFVSIRDPKVTLELLAERLRSSPFVVEAKVFEGREGAIVDTISFPVTWQGRRVVILAQYAMARMFDGVRSLLGSGGHVILYELGMDYGKELAGYLMNKLGKDYLLHNYDYGLDILAATGWGIPELQESKEDFPNLTMRLSSCLECDGRKAKEATCSFVRGFLSGILGTIAGHTVHCEETQCLAKGDSYCEFEIHTRISLIDR